jgi:hypothetical protein
MYDADVPLLICSGFCSGRQLPSGADDICLLSGSRYLCVRDESMSRAPIFTIGHSDRTWEELVEALKNQRVKFVVDVRTTPKSKRHPHVSLEVFAHSATPMRI